jgi:hypothetical protein
MMNRLTRPARFLTLLLAAMQFAVPAVLSVVDGDLARSGRVSAPHIEDVGRNQCKPPHSADCAICQFLSTLYNRQDMPATVAIATEVAVAPADPITRSGIAARHGFNSRAPPSLLV